MKKNTIQWGIFIVGELFDIHPTAAYKLTNKKLLDGGKNPVVVNSAYNNGIGGYSSKPTTEKGNMITFSDTVDANTIFYQENDFIGYPHVQGLYPKDQYKNNWTKYSLMYFTTVFRKSALTKGFDYGNKFRRDIAVTLSVKLPVYENGSPNWSYMEKYMQQLKPEVNNGISSLLDIANGRSKVEENTVKWQRFHLYDDELFSIDSGTKLDKIRMTNYNPSVNFVGRANANNGVTDYIDEIEGLKPYDAGCLTISLGGEYLGSCFIQEKPFYTSQNVNVLIPKHEMSDYCKRFIATMIFREGRLHYKAFVDELNRHMRTDFSILLPVTSFCKPDWGYMEQYMQKIESKAKATLLHLLS